MPVYTNSSKSGAMFTRKHRGMIQTSIILILMVGIGYSVYLYNLMTIKLKNMEVKTQRYHSQHQSLSSQLQVVYEERSRLESALLKEKNEHKIVKEKYDQDKQLHEDSVASSLQEQNIKYDSLKEEHTNSKNQLAEARKAIQSLEQLQQTAEKSHNDKLAELQRKQEQLNTQKESELFALQEKHRKLSDDHKRLNQLNSDLHNRLLLAQENSSNYTKLKTALTNLGYDAIQLNHPNFEKLGSLDRHVLMAHLGGSNELASALEMQRQRIALEKDIRQAAERKQRMNKEARDRELALREQKKAAQAHNIGHRGDIHAKPDANTNIVNPVGQDVQISHQDKDAQDLDDENAEDDTEDPTPNPGDADAAHPQENDAAQMENGYDQQNNQNDNQADSMQHNRYNVADQSKLDSPGLEPDPTEPGTTEPVNSDPANNEDAETYEDDVVREENNARNDEQRAREELQKSQQSQDDEHVPDHKEALEHLQDLQARQQEIAEEQQKNLEELAQQRVAAVGQDKSDTKHVIVGQITDDVDSDNPSTIEPQNLHEIAAKPQMHIPQAAHVAPNDPEGVGVAPMVSNNDAGNDRDYQQEDYNNEEDENNNNNEDDDGEYEQDDNSYRDDRVNREREAYVQHRGDRRNQGF
uniref:Golgi integral membrane protein 4-like isoform X1 n=1 Tax=Ciona intestinalis TaxID=7719 RepID=UPI000180C943|nr:Golgi integral membrane protein 4-like isoform X1 [Ciona intestinalis]|eukprot:XP_002127858.1 Golgi integral membrane protein 4-like isoform X1 [Ciona intestinalis]